MTYNTIVLEGSAEKLPVQKTHGPRYGAPVIVENKKSTHKNTVLNFISCWIRIGEYVWGMYVICMKSLLRKYTFVNNCNAFVSARCYRVTFVPGACRAAVRGLETYRVYGNCVVCVYLFLDMETNWEGGTLFWNHPLLASIPPDVKR